MAEFDTTEHASPDADRRILAIITVSVGLPEAHDARPAPNG
jgi:hypothetical protein